MKTLPSRAGWIRIFLFIAFAAVLLIPVHVGNAVRGAVPVPVRFDELHAEHGSWAVAGVVGARSDGSIPLGNALLAQVPWLDSKMSQLRGTLFPGEAEESGAASGDIPHANEVSDIIAAGEVRRVLGEPAGPLGQYVTEDTGCSWFYEGLAERDIIVSPSGTGMEMFEASSRLGHGQGPQALTVIRGGQTLGLVLRTHCDALPLTVDVSAGAAPRSSTPGSAGSSRGLLTALAMLDATTDGDLTGGKRITGTGELLVGGNTGPILGVAEKVDGADGHADVFLVDAADYDDAAAEARRIGSQMAVVEAPTIDEAVAWLCANGGGADAACRTAG